MKKVITEGSVHVYLGDTLDRDIKDTKVYKSALLIAHQIISGGKMYSKDCVVIKYQVEMEIPDVE